MKFIIMYCKIEKRYFRIVDSISSSMKSSFRNVNAVRLYV